MRHELLQAAAQFFYFLIKDLSELGLPTAWLKPSLERQTPNDCIELKENP